MNERREVGRHTLPITAHLLRCRLASGPFSAACLVSVAAIMLCWGQVCLASAPAVDPTGLLVAPVSVDPAPPSLSLAVLAPGERPELWLAQRVIDRDWGPDNDSLDIRKRAAGWKSEPFAFASSAVLPGAGQSYVGDGSGLWFALAEAAGWTARWFFQRDLERDRDQAARIAGNPADSTSGWSFQRWEAGDASRDAAALQALWVADRSAFYSLIASDPQYRDGWSGADAQSSFTHERDLGDKAAERRRWSEVGVALNHVVSAVDALRAARLHNLPVRHNLDLAVRARWNRHGPSVTAALERRF